jgi:tetratricopeptide (TPR) repeat protein
MRQTFLCLVLLFMMCVPNAQTVGRGFAQKPIEKSVVKPIRLSKSPKSEVAKDELGSATEQKDNQPNSKNEQTAIESFSKNIASVRSAIVDILLLLLLAAFLAASYWEMRRKLVIVELIDVPEDLSKKGYSPAVVAQRIVAEITSLRRAARIRGRVEEGLELGASQLDFTVPTAGISYRNIIRYARQLFRRPEERISGEIVQESEAIRMVLRTRQGRATSPGLRVATENEIAKLFEKAAFEVATLVDPVLVATYWLWAEQKEGKFERTLESVHRCIAHTTIRQHDKAYIIWGNFLTFQKQFAKAEEKYRAALRLASKSATTYNSWGNLLRAQRRYDEAARMYEKSIALDGKNPYPWNNLGNICNDRCFYREAIYRFERSISLDARYSAPWSGLGYSLWRLGRYQEAEEKFSRAVDLDPTNTWAYLGWARMYAMERRFEDAIAKLTAALENTTIPAQIYGLWGDILANTGRFTKSAAIYERATQADPNSVNGVAGRSFLSLHRRKYREAAEECERTIIRDRFYIVGWLNWGEALRRGGKLDAAIQKYQELLKIDRYRGSAHVGIGQACLTKHQIRDAILHFKRATEIDPSEAWAWRSWGDALTQMHRHRPARKKYRKAIRVNPFDANAWVGLGRTYLIDGNGGQAEICFAKACLLDGRSAFARGRLTDLLIDSGRAAEAIANLELASAAWPQEARLIAEWGSALSRLEHHEQAASKYQQAVNLDPSDSETLVRFAGALRSLNRNGEALLVLRQAVRAEPWNDTARSRLGAVLDAIGQSKTALRWFHHSMRLAPYSDPTLITWGETISRQAQRNKVLSKEERESAFQEAIDKLQIAASMNRWNSSPRRSEGKLLLDIKQAEQALAKFKQAARIDPYDWRAWAGVGDAQQQLKQHRDATGAYNRALHIYPDRHTRLALSFSLQQLGRHKEAQRELERLLQLNPKDQRAGEMLAASIRALACSQT